MTLLLASIPLMIAAVAAAIIPLAVAMRRERELHLAELAETAAPAVEVTAFPLAA